MSESLTAIGISGSPSARSRSRILLEHALGQLARRGIATDVITLNELPADALLGRRTSTELDRALAAVASVGAVVVPTGVYATDAEFDAGVARPDVIDRIERAVAESVLLAERSVTPNTAGRLAVTQSP